MRDPYFCTFARYNAWANKRLYDACGRLATSEYMKPRQSFFGSIHATLNHLLVGDRIWLGRIENRPIKLALNQVLYEDFTGLAVARIAEDERLIRILEGCDAARLDESIDYMNSRGQRFRTPLRQVFGHLFNHQTHHRGQVHDMLSQTAVPPPELDLIFFLRQ